MVSYASISDLKPVSSLGWGQNASGIYIFLNKKTWDYYIGSTLSMKDRKHQHFGSVRNNKHGNSTINHRVNIYNEKDFEMYILEEMCFPEEYNKELKREHLESRENYYINLLKPLYNIESLDIKGRRVRTYNEFLPTVPKKKQERVISDEMRRLATEAKLGKKRSLEDRVTISKAKRGSDKMFHIAMYDENDNFVRRFCLSSEASEHTGIKNSAIRNNLCGLSKFCWSPSGIRYKFKKIS